MKFVSFGYVFLLLAGGFTLAQNPLPLVNQPLVPDATAPGGPDFTLTVNGTGFVSGSTVNWNGTALATTFVDQGQLTATVPAANIVAATTASVTVTNPAPGGGTSNIEYFSVANSTADVSLTELDWQTGMAPSTESSLAGDFDGDGVLDLATPDSDSGGMCILLGVGDGSFQPAKCSGDLSGPFLVAADLNADGKQDIAAAVSNGGGVLVALGNGDGTLQAAVSLLPPPDAQQTEGLAVADFTGDGKLDLLALFHDPDNTEEIVTVYPGNGNGTFAAPIVTSLNETGGRMAIGDFNGDGLLDVAANSYIVLGNGDGTFQAPVAYSDLGASKLVAADMNLDGKLDLIALAFDSGGPTTVSVLLGNGDGTFQAPAAMSISGELHDLALADLNGDGNVDVALAGFVSGAPSIATLLGNGDGTLRAAVPRSVGIGSADSVQIGDFNLDGSPDIATWSAFAAVPNLAVLLQGEFAGATLSANSITFDAQAPGTTSPAQHVTLTNTGAASLAISGINLTGSNAGDFSQTNTCGSSLAAGASCQISVTFTPTAVGNRSGAVSITDSAPGGTQTITLTGTVQDFGVAPNSDTSQTVTAGQAANYSVAVTSILGFNQTVTLTCTGAPAQSTCTVTPASLPGSGSANVAVVTTGATAGFTQPFGGPPAGSWTAGWALASVLGLGLLAAWMAQRLRGLPLRYALVLFCLLSSATWVACGGGSTTRSRGGGTAKGTYTLTVTGNFTSGGITLSHSTQFTLVVQ